MALLAVGGAAWGLARAFPAWRVEVLAGAGALAVVIVLLSILVLFRQHREDVRRADRARALDLTPTVIRSVDGVIRYWSRGCEDLCGVPAAEARGRKKHELLQTVFPEPLKDIEGKLRRYGSWQGELIDTLPDGRRMWSMARWVWLERGLGRPPQVVETITDITAVKQAQASIRDLEAELSHVSRVAGMGEMAAALAHELNQPLTAMANFLGAADHLLSPSRPEGTTEARNAVRLAGRQAERAGDIVRRMRDFVRRGEADMSTQALPRLIEDSAGLAVILARRHPVEIAFDFDPEAGRVLANRVQIQQVLVNLLRNGVEAMREAPPPRRIVVSTRRQGALVEVTVADNGPGIAADIAETLFDPFVSTKAGGMGVGLFISRRIVEAHGGDLRVDTDVESGGVFRFTLPTSEGAIADAA